MQNDFGIRFRSEAMPARQQLLAQRLIVVDLTVEDQSHRAVFVLNRLPPACDVNNAQAGMAQARLLGAKITDAVRPTMAEGRGHTLKEAVFNMADVSANAAHIHRHMPYEFIRHMAQY